MKLETLIIKNFRGYRGEYRIKIDNITAIIGKNDAGKSTLLDALGIFFEIPICKNIGDDDFCSRGDDNEMIIGCEFSQYPQKIIIDASAETNLKDEFLLNTSGNLEILKIYTRGDDKKLSTKAKVFAYVQHPQLPNIEPLVNLKLAPLKKLAAELGISSIEENATIKSNWRKAIWSLYIDNATMIEERIPLDKEDGKSIYEQLSTAFPKYALFRADRASTDEDDEAQDPLKEAVRKALSGVQDEIDRIKNKVTAEALAIANKTITKLHQFDPALAKKLKPEFKAEPKWDTIFKLSIKGDDNISINKRGSGVRRLILFSFFQASVETEEDSENGIIYGIEEPETAQHPDNQRLIVNTLLDFSKEHQVIFTTHTPELAGAIPADSLRYISNDGPHKQIFTTKDSDAFLEKTANEMGLLPKIGAKVAVCVEGVTDIAFLENISKIFLDAGEDVIDLKNDPRVVLLPMGGSSLNSWVNKRYLQDFGMPEIYIFDRDNQPEQAPKYAEAAEELHRQGKSVFITEKREIDNYFHMDAVKSYFQTTYGIVPDFTIENFSDVDNDYKKWKKSLQRSVQLPRSIKGLLSEECIKYMTIPLLKNIDGYDEVKNWLDCIKMHAEHTTQADVLRA